METLDKLGIGQLVNPGPPAPATLTLAEDLSWLQEPLKENGRREEVETRNGRLELGGVELDYYRQKLESA